MPVNLDNLTWQMHAEDEWRLGVMVRGVVRAPYEAEVYFDDSLDEPLGGWVWIALRPANKPGYRGVAPCFEAAIAAAEERLLRD